MGKKNNNSKNKNVFKVAGSRALKAKKKAKAVQIKKIGEINRKKIIEVDKQLASVHDELRKGNIKVTKEEKSIKLKDKPISTSSNMEEIATKTIDKLDDLSV